jgi:hypothetical protein
MQSLTSPSNTAINTPLTQGDLVSAKSDVADARQNRNTIALQLQEQTQARREREDATISRVCGSPGSSTLPQYRPLDHHSSSLVLISLDVPNHQCSIIDNCLDWGGWGWNGAVRTSVAEQDEATARA